MRKIDDYGLLPAKKCFTKKNKNKQNSPILLISNRNDASSSRPKSSDSKMSQRRGLKLSKTLQQTDLSSNLRQKTLPCFPLHMSESQNIRRKQIKIEYFNNDGKYNNKIIKKQQKIPNYLRYKKHFLTGVYESIEKSKFSATKTTKSVLNRNVSQSQFRRTNSFIQTSSRKWVFEKPHPSTQYFKGSIIDKLKQF